MIIPQNPTALPLHQRAKLISIYSHIFFLFGLQNWHIASVLLQILNSEKFFQPGLRPTDMHVKNQSRKCLYRQLSRQAWNWPIQFYQSIKLCVFKVSALCVLLNLNTES